MLRRPLHALRSTGTALALMAAAPLLGAPDLLRAQDAAPPGLPAAAAGFDTLAANPFAGVATHHLANGTRIWFKRLEGAADVTVGAVLPYGWDQDPPGREELAHFTEHMLFGDHAGRSEEAILDEIEARGGQRNGITTPDHTFYYVTLPAAHGLYGVSWLGRVLEPKAMEPAVVERNRQPVALEIRARPRQLFDHLWAALNPEWLRAPEYWEREFGLRTRAARVYDRYRSLQAITAQDLQAFYDRYYTPEALTVVVVGDVPVEAALAAVDSAFGALTPRPAPDRYGPLEDPGRTFRSVTWGVRPNVRYQRIFKVYGMDAREHLRLLFLARYLDRRLSMRLRFGDTKAVYGVQLQVAQRGPAAHLALTAPVDPDRFEYARAVVDEELARLGAGEVPPDDFASDRAAVVARVQAENQESRDLVFWVHNAFYDPAIHEDFPDLAAAFASMEQTELAALVGGRLTPARQAVWISRPQPLGQGTLALLAVVLLALTLRLTARRLTRPVDMTGLRYVARIRGTPGWSLLLGGIWLGAAVVTGRLVAAVGERAAYRWVLPVDAYPFQMGVLALAAMAAVAALVGWLSLPPRKLLLFRDHLRVKHLAYRSRALPFRRLEVRRASWLDVVRAGQALRTLPLALGVVRPALWIRPDAGTGYLVAVRDPEEFLEMLGEAAGRAVEPDAVENRRSEPDEAAGRAVEPADDPS